MILGITQGLGQNSVKGVIYKGLRRVQGLSKLPKGGYIRGSIAD